MAPTLRHEHHTDRDRDGSGHGGCRRRDWNRSGTTRRRRGTPITGEALTKASQAALTFTGGGTVTGTEVGDEESYYEVEVTKADGSQVDVQLNDNFLVVGSRLIRPAPTPARRRRRLAPAMNAIGRGLATLCACTLLAACADGKPAMSAECIKVVDESGEVADACLPVSPDAQRVDLAKPTFGNPTSITNPLHPTSQVQQTIYGGHVNGKPFRTEVSLLPGVKPTVWQGKSVEYGDHI